MSRAEESLTQNKMEKLLLTKFSSHVPIAFDHFSVVCRQPNSWLVTRVVFHWYHTHTVVGYHHGHKKDVGTRVVWWWKLRHMMGAECRMSEVLKQTRCEQPVSEQ